MKGPAWQQRTRRKQHRKMLKRQFADIQKKLAEVPALAGLPKKTAARYSRYGRLTHYKLGGLLPVQGQPGLFYDLSTLQTVNIRDFRESDKYDTVYIGATPS